MGPWWYERSSNGMGIDWYGVDGDTGISYRRNELDYSLVHDFTLGEAKIEKTFDLIWCVKILEHVEEKYVDQNYMDHYLN